jgi:hypothetical protein
MLHSRSAMFSLLSVIYTLFSIFTQNKQISSVYFSYRFIICGSCRLKWLSQMHFWPHEILEKKLFLVYDKSLNTSLNSKQTISDNTAANTWTLSSFIKLYIKVNRYYTCIRTCCHWIINTFNFSWVYLMC